MKRFLAKIILMLAPVMLMATANYYLDPSMLFSLGPLRDATEKLAQGESVPVYGDYDERRLRREMLTEPSLAQADVLILGSSRSMTVNQALFDGLKSLNLSVSGATLEDLVTLEYLASKRSNYDHIVLGLDPWILNPEHGDIRWKTLATEHKSSLKALDIEAKPSGDSIWRYKVSELFSPRYLWDGLNSLQEDRELVISIRSDGSIQYPANAFKDASPSNSGRPVYKLDPFPRLDGYYQELLSTWLKKLRSRESKIVVLLAPFRPSAYNRLKSEPEYAAFREAENYLTQLCQEQGLRIVGSYNPSDLDLEEGQFKDDIHVDPEWLQQYLTRVRLFPAKRDK